MCDSPETLARLDKIAKLLDIQINGGHTSAPEDQTYAISNTQGFVLDYKGRKHLYLFTAVALTLNLNEIGTLAINANTWTDISFRQGIQLFTTNSANPVLILVRATNETIQGASAGGGATTIVTQGTNPWVTSISNVNANGQALSSASSPVVLPSDQLPLSALLADATSNPTISKIQNFPMVWNGTTWDRARSVAGAATGTKSNVASSATSVTILAANTSRKGAVIYNDSTQILYLDLSGGTASTSSYSVQIPAQGYFEVPGPAIYNGLITGIWAAANGNARVTELS